MKKKKGRKHRKMSNIFSENAAFAALSTQGKLYSTTFAEEEEQ
jgi:hypothetical protein